MDKPHTDTNKGDPDEIEQLRAELAAAKEKLAEYEQGYWGRRAGRECREANNLRILLRDVVNGKASCPFEGNIEGRIKAALSVDVEPNAAIERDERAMVKAYNDWAFYKKGEAIGRMDGNQAGMEGFIAGAEWQTRATMKGER
ncbi:hypothetical protein [Pseudomonas sp.]|uniref:hypothetical protein n=1 Tax=Pseudomonas sp. TaxID=306 RepID=UPI0031E1BE97